MPTEHDSSDEWTVMLYFLAASKILTLKARKCTSNGLCFPLKSNSKIATDWDVLAGEVDQRFNLKSASNTFMDRFLGELKVFVAKVSIDMALTLLPQVIRSNPSLQ